MPSPHLPLGRRAFLGGALAAASLALQPARRDLAARLERLARDDDHERTAIALREALLDVDDDAWAAAASHTGRTTLWSHGDLRLDLVVLAPRARLEPTATPGVVTVTRAVAGLARYALHDPVDAHPADVFVVRRTREGVLTPGRMLDRTPDRDTIRALRAGHAGATLLEAVATRAADTDERAVDIARTPHDAFEGLHAARWLDAAAR